MVDYEYLEIESFTDAVNAEAKKLADDLGIDKDKAFHYCFNNRDKFVNLCLFTKVVKVKP